MEVEEIFVKTEPAEESSMFFEGIEENINEANNEVETVLSKEEAAFSYVCNICMKLCGTKVLLEHHLTIVHRPLTVQILYGAYCNLCRLIFDEIAFDTHVCHKKICLLKSVPVHVNKIYKSKTNKRECTTCRICNKLVVKWNKLEHLRTVHRPLTINYGDKTNYSFCDTCKNLFQYDIFTHFPCNAVDVKCFFCLTNMPLKSHFISHNLLWGGFRKFQCNICKEFTTTMNFSELNEHIKTHNNGLGVFHCVKCKMHMDQSALETHYQTRHQGCKCVTVPCCCDEYNEYFYIKNILKVDVPPEYFKSSENTPEGNDTTDDITENTPEGNGTTVDITENKGSCSSPSSSKSCESFENKSCTEIKNKFKALLNGKHILLTEGLSEKDRIDTENNLHDYKNLKNNVENTKASSSKPKKPLSKFQLLKKRRGLMNRNRHRGKHKSSKSDEQQNFALKEEQDTLISEIMCSEIVKEEMELVDSKNIKNELLNLLEDIPFEDSQRSENVEQDEKESKLTEEYLAVRNGPHKKLKMQSNLNNVQPNQEEESSEASLEKNPSDLQDDVDSEHSESFEELTFRLSPDPEHENDCENSDTCIACGLCGLDFSTSDSLNEHLIEIHQLKSTYLKQSVYCAHCKMFNTKNHFPCKKSEGEEICLFCNMSLPKIEHFELHNIEFLSYSELICSLCNDKTKYKIKTLNEHRINDHNDAGVYECLICKVKFSTHTKMKEHLVYNKHEFDVGNSAEMFKLRKNHSDEVKYSKCKNCDRIFFEDRYLKSHRCQQFKCFECSKTFVQQTSLIYHLATHTKENVFKCSICDILFDKQSKLTAHMQIHNDNGTNPHKCDVCNRLFSHKCKLLVHKISHRETNADNGDK